METRGTTVVVARLFSDPTLTDEPLNRGSAWRRWNPMYRDLQRWTEAVVGREMLRYWWGISPFDHLQRLTNSLPNLSLRTPPLP